MKKIRSALWVLLLCLFPALTCSGQQKAAQVALLSVNGTINPVTVAYFLRNLEGAARRGDALVLVELDTPGGLDTAMRDAVKGIFAAQVPVAVLVTPPGARAASAGAVIALAADVCAMSPGTNIGAAHPVSLGGKPDKVMEEKVLNDSAAYLEGIAAQRGRNVEVARQMVRGSLSLSAEAALKERVIDLIAQNPQDLVDKLEGRRLIRDGKPLALNLAGARITRHEMGTRDRILNTISNPDLAYLLMLAGIIGIFFELSTPGAILPGVIGGISLLLAFFAFQTLPVNYAGVLLILLAIILFIAEIKIVSHGILAIAAVISLILGSLLLFPSPEPGLRLSLGVIVATVTVTTLFFVVVVAKGVEAYRQKPVTGKEAMIGAEGIAATELRPEGKVLIRGEYWNAEGAEPIARGDRVEVTALAGLKVSVRKVRPPKAPGETGGPGRNS
ncbi:serine protease [Geomonas silvestris]|uniref:Serine protease n=1 Tax=Geomonas silvestris TaxID=2740184 RepID=A0A6V8ML36_9BACT|nr:nodulation protein NfeD [Geomonas silvestris]GFO60644.1 serine protease [Geomonas silvestris]